MLRRLHAFDRILLLVLVPAWLGCFALSLRAILRPAGATSFRVTAWNADAVYPEVVALAPFVPADEAGVRPGDGLVRMAGEDMRGVDGLGFYARFLSAAWTHARVPAVVERGERTFETTLASVSWAAFAPLVAIAPLFACFGVAILLKAPRSSVARAIFQAFLVGAFFLSPFTGPGWMAWLHVSGLCLSSLLVGPLVVRFLLLFPDGEMPASPWLRLLPYPFALFGVTYVALFSSFPYSRRQSEWILNVASALLVLGALALLQRIYRRADPLARRQLKWSFFGVYLACVPPLVAFAWLTLFPEQRYDAGLSIVSLGLVPVFVYVALYRYNLLDVDRLLSATASYNMLAVVALGAGLVAVPRAAEGASALLGLDSESGRVAFSLALAALVIPAQRRLRPQLERLFFRERYAIDQGIAELLPVLSTCRDARELTDRLGTDLVTLLRPQTCAIYARVGASYAPVFVQGQIAPAAFEADGPLVGTLRGRTQPLALAAPGRRADEAALGAFDRAALETLGAEVMVPIRQGDALAAFLCFGPKRSGDVYTPTDLSVLAALAETVSQQLLRFDQEQTIREGRAMQESLRRYVPGAIAEELAEGADLSARESEVSVLFVDIRGYTSFAESRRAKDIFATINQYTETVSSVVRRHRGTVAEFNGDGMMAVFGAPREVSDKERAAVAAGREIVAAVAGLRVADGEGRAAALSVGVGVATGQVCVGNIRAVDRLIWSAIGNTTNLAARLQVLSRDLAAAVVIDADTWGALTESERSGFVSHPNVAVRGRSDRRDVYALPLAARPTPEAAAAGDEREELRLVGPVTGRER